jgi:large subunit ribosomal protein L14
MIFFETKLKSSDNSGCVLVKCIKVTGSSKPRWAVYSDCILVSARIVKPKLKVRKIHKIVKGDLYKAILARTKKPTFLFDNSSIKFFENNVILLRKSQPRTFGGPRLAGNRVFGPVITNLALKKKYPKLFSLSPAVLR